MKVQSTVSPPVVWIRFVENGVATARLTQNVTSAQNETGQTIYEYEEIEVTVTDRADLSSYLEGNLGLFFGVALANAQTEQIALINAGLNQTLIGGFASKTAGHSYVTTTNGQANMEGDLKRFELDSSITSVQFYTIDAGWIAHSHTDLQNAFLDGGTWKDAQYVQAQTLVAQVNTLASQSGTTVAQIKAVVWTPATY